MTNELPSWSAGKYRREYQGEFPVYHPELIEEYRNAGYWGDETIPDRFEQVVTRRGPHTAVIDASSGDSFSYIDLASKVAAIRSGLHRLGIGPGDAVTVQLPNWWEQVAVTIAIIELGALLVPVNVRVRGELEYMLSYTHSKAAVVPESFRGYSHADLVGSMQSRLPALGHVILVRGNGSRPYPDSRGWLGFDQVAAARTDEPRPRISANSAWQIIFTSGTTAAPKGVLRTHNNTLWTMRNLVEDYGYLIGDGSDVALAVLPISFVFAQYLLAFSALLHGGTLVLQDVFEAHAALSLIEKCGVTYTGVVPSMVPAFLEIPDWSQRKFSSLRTVSPAGEPVTRERKEQLEAIFGCDIRESYGLAECTWPLGQPPGSSREKRMSATGIPSTGAELRIVNDALRDVEDGEIGELLLRGPTLFPGYLRNPAATSAAIDEDGWLHSGDLVLRDEDGHFALSGRKKDVIRRGGAQVIPQEIEDALQEHPAVRAVAVVGLPDPRRGEMICACVVLRKGQSVTIQDLIDFLRDRLAVYKLPERIEVMEGLPLSPNGKVLKAELRERLHGSGNG